eukprot:12921379-Prorocentrum_lima.AAC.1
MGFAATNVWKKSRLKAKSSLNRCVHRGEAVLGNDCFCQKLLWVEVETFFRRGSCFQKKSDVELRDVVRPCWR